MCEVLTRVPQLDCTEQYHLIFTTTQKVALEVI